MKDITEHKVYKTTTGLEYNNFEDANAAQRIINQRELVTLNKQNLKELVSECKHQHTKSDGVQIKHFKDSEDSSGNPCAGSAYHTVYHTCLICRRDLTYIVEDDSWSIW